MYLDGCSKATETTNVYPWTRTLPFSAPLETPTIKVIILALCTKFIICNVFLLPQTVSKLHFSAQLIALPQTTKLGWKMDREY